MGNNLVFLVSFWRTHEVSICIEKSTSRVESNYFEHTIYQYNTCIRRALFPPIFSIIILPQQQKKLHTMSRSLVSHDMDFMHLFFFFEVGKERGIQESQMKRNFYHQIRIGCELNKSADNHGSIFCNSFLSCISERRMKLEKYRKDQHHLTAR